MWIGYSLLAGRYDFSLLLSLFRFPFNSICVRVHLFVLCVCLIIGGSCLIYHIIYLSEKTSSNKQELQQRSIFLNWRSSGKRGFNPRRYSIYLVVYMFGSFVIFCFSFHLFYEPYKFLRSLARRKLLT